MSDADDFGQKASKFLHERKQYQFEEKVLRKLLPALHEHPSRMIAELRSHAQADEGIAFWQFHHAFNFPMALTGYKLRRVDFIKALKHPEKTPLMRAWKRHAENYEGFEYLGVFYESIGDRMPILLLHNCDRLPLAAPFWRCQRALPDGTSLFFEPLESALIAFQHMGWRLEDV